MTMPTHIDKYSQWSLKGVTPVSHHSAIFHFQSHDRKRGTPNPRGGGRSPPTPKTWHTTLLAEVGCNEEGPLPWIERDYTPISGALDWERGQCDILIKIYSHGDATSWLHGALTTTTGWQESTPANDDSNSCIKVWLSQPVQTLTIPSLVPGKSAGFNPASVLLLLAGTGVVALPQILHHRDPHGKIGISMKRPQQLHVPVDLILSCRSDDVLMLPEIIAYCRGAVEGKGNEGLRKFTLLMTQPTTSPEPEDQAPVPFPECGNLPTQLLLKELDDLPNARVMWTRLTNELVSEAISAMPRRCRIIVSGPSGFNSAARGMLLNTDHVQEDAITILEA